jgi:putative ABC transport system permease protein
MLKLIGHSIRMRLIQSASIAFMVFVGVAVLFAFLLINRGTSDGLAAYEERGGAQILVLPAKASEYRGDDALLFSGAPASFYIGSDLFTQIQGFDGVERATYQFFSQSLDANCCSASGETRLVGIDPATDWLVASLLGDSQTWDGELQDDQVILGGNVDGYESGSGRLLGNDVSVVAVMAKTGTGFDDSIVISADYARRLSANISGYQRFWEQNGDPAGLISAVLIDVIPGQEERLSAQLDSLRDVRIVERSAVIARSQEQLQTLFGLLAAVAAVMALASLLQLAARYYSVAWERKSEFALYRALGATRADIRRLICGEAFLLTGAGAACGLLAGAGLLAWLRTWLFAAEAFPFLMPAVATTALAALVVLLLFAAITLLAVVVPLRRIARIEPSLALQQRDIA